MERAKVFISSILNFSVEDLSNEREVVLETVESYPFLLPWAFEKASASFEPLDQSYLRNVEECDLFVVVIGAEPSDAVAAEIQRAKECNKPILAFAKTVQHRRVADPSAHLLLTIKRALIIPLQQVNAE